VVAQVQEWQLQNTDKDMMRELANKFKLVAALVITAALVVIGALNLRDRLSARPIPSDGVYWVNTESGVQAKAIRPESPLASLIKEGDYVRYVFYRGKYEEVDRAEALYLYLDRLGVGADARYTIEHHDQVLQSIFGIDRPIYDVDFKVISEPQSLGLGLYLALVGLVYLVVGLFVLFKQSRARLTYHFLAWFLASFVVYFYSSTREFSAFDKLVHLLDSAALALLAPLFLHFCAKFPSPRRWLGRFRGALLYVPAVALIALELLWHYAPGVFGGSLVKALERLNIAELWQFAVYFTIGSSLLVDSFLRAQRPELRQQLKWIVWGLGLSVLPFVAFYFIPYVADLEITPPMEAIAYGPLILIPMSFGYSIIRYRLMDVDVIMRRSFVHVMATVAVGAIYMAVLLGVGDLVKFIWATADLNAWKTRVVVVIGMLVVAMLFAPIKNRLQVWADRWFYGERYTLRMGLQDFGRALAQTTALPCLLNSLSHRLSEMLSVRKVAIFIEDGQSPSGFQLAHGMGLSAEVSLPENIKEIIRARSSGRGFICIEDLIETGKQRARGENLVPEDDKGDGLAQSGLYYYVPCVVRDRMVAIIAVGRASSGALLTSEDTELLRALSGYVAVAIDNSLLYRSEMEKAEELARLKEFSENVIESVSVGIVVINLDSRITTWNSAMEKMFGMERDRVLGRSIYEVIDPDLIETIESVTGQGSWAIRDVRHIYKYSATVSDGRSLILNITLAPFEAARGVVAGTLMMVENITERVQLEQQLQQREKLSSIGLLAAGVAHEVNTPLAGISSYTQMLLQQIPETDPKHKLLEKIHSQTLRASGIVNNLLNFSRTGDAQFREVDINRVLDDTLQLLEPQLRNTKIEIIRHYAPDLPAGYGNASKLQQVFMNMILNARDAMPVGGRLTIQTRLVETSLVIDFRDTGVGIAPENIARIYDPFFTTKEVGQGTGLGLALSYGIIQEHGGRIFVESRPGEGTHFTIKLPAAFARQIQAASD
jgi:two-component system NtrC family sensor kinase